MKPNHLAEEARLSSKVGQFPSRAGLPSLTNERDEMFVTKKKMKEEMQKLENKLMTRSMARFVEAREAFEKSLGDRIDENHNQNRKHIDDWCTAETERRTNWHKELSAHNELVAGWLEILKNHILQGKK